MKITLGQILLPLALATAVNLFAPANAQTIREKAEQGDAITFSLDQLLQKDEEEQDRTTWKTVQCDNQTSVRGYLDNYPDGFHSADAQKCLKATTEQALRTFQGHTEGVKSVAFSPDGKTVISGSSDNTLRLWDVHTGQSLRTFQGHTEGVNSVAFSPDGKYVISGGYDETLRLWDVQTGQALRTFSGHQQWVESVAFSPNGKYVISASFDGTLRLWNVRTGQSLRTFRHMLGAVVEYRIGQKTRRTFSSVPGWVKSVAFSPDGKHVISGGFGSTLILWDVHTGKDLRTFRGHQWTVRSVAFSPDGKYVISGSGGIELIPEPWPYDVIPEKDIVSDNMDVSRGSGDTLILWDVHTGQALRTFADRDDFVNSVAFSPDGKYVISDGFDDTLRLWDVQTGLILRTFRAHQSSVSSVAFSPNGKYVISGSYDGVLHLWDVHAK